MLCQRLLYDTEDINSALSIAIMLHRHVINLLRYISDSSILGPHPWWLHSITEVMNALHNWRPVLGLHRIIYIKQDWARWNVTKFEAQIIICVCVFACVCVRVYVCVLQRDYNIIVFKVKGFISKHGGGTWTYAPPPSLRPWIYMCVCV